MQALLRVVQKQANVQQVRLLNETVIGRSVDCNLKIASTQVSRRHCRVVVNDLGVYIEDLCSSNGTYLDGKRLLPNQLTLAPAGSQLVIGPATFAVEYRNTGVTRPELGASRPLAEDVNDEIAPAKTTSLSQAEVDAALQSTGEQFSDAVPFESPFASFVTESAVSPVESPSAEEPPQRLRSLFGLFQRGSKKEPLPATPVPFLPTEPESESNSAEDADAPASSHDTPSVEPDGHPSETAVDPNPNSAFALDFDAAPDAPAEPTDSDNPFRQFSQF